MPSLLLQSNKVSYAIFCKQYTQPMYIFTLTLLRIHLRPPTILKTSNKSVWSNIFWYVKVHIFWKFTLYTEIKYKCYKRFLWTKWTLQKMHSFFFRELQLITVFLLIRDSYTSWTTWFISLKLCVGISIFDYISFLLNFIFLFNKKHGLFDFKW